MLNSSAFALAAGSYEESLQDTVQYRFGFPALSSDQDSLVRASIEGHNVLGVLPTGGGKSACFQIPGIVTRSRTLVVSPLIALQDNQVRALRNIGLKAFALHSSLSEVKKTAVTYYFKTAPKDEPCFLYISPELLLTETFHAKFDEAGFNRIAVDEAHCVSTWGNTFRPDYQRIRVAVQRLRIHHCAAFTATVDPRIEKDIKNRIPLGPNYVRVAASPLRPNLEIKVEHPVRDTDSNREVGSKKTMRLLQLLTLPEYQGAVIIYCGARDTATSLYLRLRKYHTFVAGRGYTPYLFHALLPYEDREEALQGFLQDEKPVIIATSAFGMGIDRPDVRQVIHYSTPYALIDYAQQIGRAGRDGLPALCTSFHSSEHYLDNALRNLEFHLPGYDFVEKVHGWVRDTVTKLPEAERRRYDIRRFLTRARILAERNDQIRNKDAYLSRVMSAVALLQRAGIISETGDGLAVFGIEPGGTAYQKLIELTQMHARMQMREKERIQEFFGTAGADQPLLWDILSKD